MLARNFPMSGARQRGMSLFPALMFLLVLSVIGVSAMNSTLMQEKMVSNTKDLNLAFQAAEAGLRDAEADVTKNIDTGTVFTATCINGLCTPPSTWPTPTSTDISKLVDWSDTSKTRAYGDNTGNPALPTVAAQPRYVIERLSAPPGCRRVPAAAWGSGAGRRAYIRVATRTGSPRSVAARDKRRGWFFNQPTS